ncbi:MAG TPA: hypothetical protein VJ851_03710 [Jatrophihabitans sp.]|nr:hypothetical protein [Jatrophihabitans sp.]
MNGDVLELLRRADPASDGGYDQARIERQVARILQADAAPMPAARGRGPVRRLGVPAAAFVAVAAAGLGSAAAAGWLTPQATHAFDSPAARQLLRQQFGTTADLSRAQERVSAPGPDGSTMTIWTVPVGDRGSCTAVLVSKKSAAVPGGNEPSDLPSFCDPTPTTVQRSVRYVALDWVSKATRTHYLIYGGQVGSATGVELRLTSGVRLTAATENGYFLLPAVRSDDLHCAAVIGLDQQGHQVGLASYLSAGCPGDPYQPGTTYQAPPGSTVIEHAQSQAVGYADGIAVGIDWVIQQDPSRGVGSARPGMSLITVRLQFYQELSHQPLPSTASFDLLIGAQHLPATADPGKQHDPDLNGVWTPPGSWTPPPGQEAWLPQRSFDVPTDQLTTMQVRINGDAVHPTIVFDHVQVQGSP